MLPDHTLSSVLVKGTYLVPDSYTPTSTLDYELGGIDIQNPLQGLQVKTWMAFVDGNDVKVAAADKLPVVIFSFPGVTEISLAFDQNMRPTISYMRNGNGWLYWYDSLPQMPVHTEFVGAITPRVCLDDKRYTQTGTSDVLLAYTKNNNLYFREQRDRFTIEYLLKTEINATLLKLGMTNKNRVQFELMPVS